MKFCSSCGKPVPDDARFCPECGQAVESAAAYQENSQPEETAGNAAYGGTDVSDASAVAYGSPEADYVYSPGEQVNGGASAAEIKKIGGSPILLLYIICSIAVVVVGLISANSSASSLTNGVQTSATLVGFIPGILIIIAALMFFFDCKGSGSASGKGIGLYKAAKIVVIVVLGIVAAAAVFAVILGNAVLGSGFIDDLFAYYGVSGLQGVASGVLTIVLIMVLVMVALMILFEVKLMKGAELVRECLKGAPARKAFPVFPFVIYVIITIFSAISLIYTLFQVAEILRYLNYYNMSGYGGILSISVISSILAVVQALLATVLLAKLRSAVNLS